VGVLQITEKTGYKIAKWVVLALAVVLIGAGGLIALTSGVGGGNDAPPPEAMHITAPGLVAHPELGRYSMSVFQKETSIMVNTYPWGSSRRVNFEIQQGAEHLDITPWVWPGSMAIMTLLPHDGQYQFGQTIIILISSGQVQEFLHVHLVLPPDQVSFNFGLRNVRTGVRIDEISAGSYFQDVHAGGAVPDGSGSIFEFSAGLNVFGGHIAGTQFTASPQGTMDHGIRLFGIAEDEQHPSGVRRFSNIFIPLEIVMQLIDSRDPNAYREFRFMISAEHLGSTHIDFFVLRIRR